MTTTTHLQEMAESLAQIAAIAKESTYDRQPLIEQTEPRTLREGDGVTASLRYCYTRLTHEANYWGAKDNSQDAELVLVVDVTRNGATATAEMCVGADAARTGNAIASSPTPARFRYDGKAWVSHEATIFNGSKLVPLLPPAAATLLKKWATELVASANLTPYQVIESAWAAAILNTVQEINHTAARWGEFAEFVGGE